MKLFNRISSTTLVFPSYTRSQEEGISKGYFPVTDRNDCARGVSTADRWGHTSPLADGPLPPEKPTKNLDYTSE